MKWSENEISILRKLYPDNKNEDISKIMNKSIKSIISKSFKLGLKKSKSHKREMISVRNKKTNRDLTYDLLKKIALMYKTRSEFQLMDPSAYTTSRKMKILDDICLHMVSRSFSLPQKILYNIVKHIFEKDIVLYNYRSLIDPYELDVYVENKIAFEYDGNYWHMQDTVDKLKLCNDKKIDLIKIVENNRKYESDIKEQLVQNLFLINKHLNIKINEDYISSIKIDYGQVYEILGIDKIKEDLKGYQSISDLQKNNYPLYYKILKLDNYDELIHHLRKRKKYKIDYIKETIGRYKTLLSFIKEESALYLYLRRNKMHDLLDCLERKSRNI